MITAWMIYAAAASVPVALCTWGAARLLRRHNLTERYVWIGAILLALSIPVLRLVPWNQAGEAQPTPAAVIVLDLGLPDTVSVAGDGLLARGGSLATWGWLAMSLLLGIRIGRSWWRLARARSRWTEVTVAGENVFLTDDVGPAVFGVVRPRIVLPRWMRDLPLAQLDNVVRHEMEHVRAKDPLALASVLALRIALPWHPGIWFLTDGLLEAIEVDCDRRVLRARQDVRGYGETVLAIAARMRPGPRQPVAAFSEPVHSIRRRLIAMTQPRRTMNRVGMLALAAVGVVALVGACETPLPSSSVGEPETEAAPQGGSEDPTVTIRVDGGDESLREQLQERLLERAEELLERLKAAQRGETPVIVDGPESEFRENPVTEFGPSPENADLSENPVFTPFTERPTLRNIEEVQAALESEYPRELSEAGIGGRANVWLFIDTEGAVQSTRIQESSGYPALDQAALNVARVVRFTPAKNMDRTVPVWIALPISFAVKQ
jgi:TonB family protein